MKELRLISVRRIKRKRKKKSNRCHRRSGCMTPHPTPFSDSGELWFSHTLPGRERNPLLLLPWRHPLHAPLLLLCFIRRHINGKDSNQTKKSGSGVSHKALTGWHSAEQLDTFCALPRSPTSTDGWEQLMRKFQLNILNGFRDPCLREHHV